MNRNTQIALVGIGAVALVVIVIVFVSMNNVGQSTIPDIEKENQTNSEKSVQAYPIMEHIPFYSEDRWSLDTEPPTSDYESPPDGYKMPFFVYVDTVLLDYELRRPIEQQRQRLDAMRTSAMKYLTDKGIKVEEYAFRYTDPYLQEKYGTSRPRKQ
jgi:hypothetical protein